jgi:hypothetical protein
MNKHDEALPSPDANFQGFYNRFIAIIDTQSFGGISSRRPSPYGSPAYREIQKEEFREIRTKSFIRELYNLAAEYHRLQSVRPQLPVVAQSIYPIIDTYQHAERRLLKIAKDLQDLFIPKYIPDIQDPLRQRVWAAADELETVSYELRKRAMSHTERIHEKHRKPGHVPSGWKSLVRDVDYDLKDTDNAPKKWLYRSVDGAIRSTRNGRRLTETTRMKLIVATVRAATGDTVEPTAIKESLRYISTYKKKNVRP